MVYNHFSYFNNDTDIARYRFCSKFTNLKKTAKICARGLSRHCQQPPIFCLHAVYTLRIKEGERIAPYYVGKVFEFLVFTERIFSVSAVTEEYFLNFGPPRSDLAVFRRFCDAYVISWRKNIFITRSHFCAQFFGKNKYQHRKYQHSFFSFLIYFIFVWKNQV